MALYHSELQADERLDTNRAYREQETVSIIFQRITIFYFTPVVINFVLVKNPIYISQLMFTEYPIYVRH